MLVCLLVCLLVFEKEVADSARVFALLLERFVCLFTCLDSGCSFGLDGNVLGIIRDIF